MLPKQYRLPLRSTRGWFSDWQRKQEKHLAVSFMQSNKLANPVFGIVLSGWNLGAVKRNTMKRMLRGFLVDWAKKQEAEKKPKGLQAVVIVRQTAQRLSPAELKEELFHALDSII